MNLLAQIIAFVKDDKEVRSAAVVTLSTTTISVVSYVISHYDKLLAASLSAAGILFLIWKWRKAAKTQLCDRVGCPRRKVPNDTK